MIVKLLSKGGILLLINQLPFQHFTSWNFLDVLTLLAHFVVVRMKEKATAVKVPETAVKHDKNC
jgi:hypothetical protein